MSKMDKLLDLLDLMEVKGELSQKELNQELETSSGFTSNVISGYWRGVERGRKEGAQASDLGGVLSSLEVLLRARGVKENKVAALLNLVRSTAQEIS